MSEVKTTEAKATETKANKVVKTGLVVKAAMDKTITVKVDRLMQHSKFQKIIRRNKQYLAHDENSSAGVGDTVKIMECRPISKLKNWRLVEIISKAK
jgi:small subunit ribosomal protein S17